MCVCFYLFIYLFFDLHKVFDTVKQDILPATLECCGIPGIANNWFKFYQFNKKQQKQVVSINGYVSNQTSVKYDAPQGSVVGPLLILNIQCIIGDLNQA